MNYKSISISQKAYEKLSAVKAEDETMDDLILRLLRYNSLSKHKTEYKNPLQPLRFKEQEKNRIDRIVGTGNQFHK